MRTLKKIALISNDLPTSKEVKDKLSKRLEGQYALDMETPDIVISIGGDGTLLSAMHLYESQLNHVRFLGIHTGHLGFYTDFLPDNLDLLTAVLEKEEADLAVKYPLLKVTVKFGDGGSEAHYALNESTIRRVSRTLVADVKISGVFFEKFRGDGLSVSTPSGSTAYNKSIGGAVVHPSIFAMQLTEIASLNNSVFRTLGSSMVVADKDVISLHPDEAKDYNLTVDQLEFQYENMTQIDYALDGTSISFVNGAHTPFWDRVRASFIGDLS